MKTAVRADAVTLVRCRVGNLLFTEQATIMDGGWKYLAHPSLTVKQVNQQIAEVSQLFFPPKLSIVKAAIPTVERFVPL
jgi:hypothetical protein